jgi:hypothetical protein
MRRMGVPKAETMCATAAEIRPTPKGEVIEMRAFGGELVMRVYLYSTRCTVHDYRHGRKIDYEAVPKVGDLK